MSYVEKVVLNNQKGTGSDFLLLYSKFSSRTNIHKTSVVKCDKASAALLTNLNVEQFSKYLIVERIEWMKKKVALVLEISASMLLRAHIV